VDGRSDKAQSVNARVRQGGAAYIGRGQHLEYN